MSTITLFAEFGWENEEQAFGAVTNGIAPQGMPYNRVETLNVTQIPTHVYVSVNWEGEMTITAARPGNLSGWYTVVVNGPVLNV